jgi:hypothetical protein
MMRATVPDEDEDEEHDDAQADMLAELEALEELARPRPAIREHYFAERGG